MVPTRRGHHPEVPGCTAREHLHVHQLIHVADGGHRSVSGPIRGRGGRGALEGGYGIGHA